MAERERPSRQSSDPQTSRGDRFPFQGKKMPSPLRRLVDVGTNSHLPLFYLGSRLALHDWKKKTTFVRRGQDTLSTSRRLMTQNSSSSTYRCGSHLDKMLSFVMQFLILFILLKSNKHKTTYIVCHLKYLCQTGCKCEPEDWSTNS